MDVDLDPDVDRADFLHVCYPFEIPDFVGATLAYIERFDPRCVVVHSTIAPRTTQAIRDGSDSAAIYYSPVRGKHVDMESHLKQYKKFVSGPDDELDAVVKHLEEAGFQVERMEPTEALETAKLLETTYFGLLIAWAQEVERFAEAAGSNHGTVNRFIEEVPFLPSNYFPGHIGGHCVMPNLDILQKLRPSEILDFIKSSNERAIQGGGD